MLSHCSTKSILTAAAVAAIVVAVAFRGEIIEIVKQTNINMNDIIFCFFMGGLLILGALLWRTLVLLNRHTKQHKEISDKISASGNKLEVEVTGIRTYIEIIAYIAIVFCVGVAIHYLIVCLPRHREIKASNTYYQNMGVDYLGLIVAIFAIIVTVLVGWQIYSTIRAKDEIDRVKKEAQSLAESHKEALKQEYDKRISELENSNKTLIAKLDKLEASINVNANISKFQADYVLATSILKFSQLALEKEAKPKYKGKEHKTQFGRAYKTYLKAFYSLLKSNPAPYQVEDCLKKMNVSLDNVRQFNESVYMDCEELYSKIIEEYGSKIDKKTRKKFDALYSKQTSKPYHNKGAI